MFPSVYTLQLTLQFGEVMTGNRRVKVRQRRATLCICARTQPTNTPDIYTLCNRTRIWNITNVHSNLFVNVDVIDPPTYSAPKISHQLYTEIPIVVSSARFILLDMARKNFKRPRFSRSRPTIICDV